MSWFRLDDHFPDHPKVLRAGGEAAWLYVAGGCYCAQYLTDGRIPKAAVPTLTTLKSVSRLAAVLVAEELWHDRGDHYEVHDYLTYNPTKASVEEQRRKARERATNGARTSHEVQTKNARSKRAPVPVPEFPTETSAKTPQQQAQAVQMARNAAYLDELESEPMAPPPIPPGGHLREMLVKQATA